VLLDIEIYPVVFSIMALDNCSFARLLFYMEALVLILVEVDFPPLVAAIVEVDCTWVFLNESLPLKWTILLW